MRERVRKRERQRDRVILKRARQSIYEGLLVVFSTTLA